MDPATAERYPLSLHVALPISAPHDGPWRSAGGRRRVRGPAAARSEEHTSELQSREKLVCRLLLETKKSCTRGGRGSCPGHQCLSAARSTETTCTWTTLGDVRP